MNRVDIKFKNMAHGVLFYTDANDVLIKDNWIHLRHKLFPGIYRTLAIFDKDDISSLMIGSQVQLVVNKE